MNAKLEQTTFVWMQSGTIRVDTVRRATNFFVALVAVLCAFAADNTANAGIDKSTVEAGRVGIKVRIDASHDLVVRP